MSGRDNDGRRIRVPLALDSQVRVPVGPMMVPLRTVFLMGLVSPLAFACLQMPFLSTTWQVSAAAGILLAAFAFSTPMREGVWLGTYGVFLLASRLMPTAILRGQAKRARIQAVGESTQLTRVRGLFSSKLSVLASLRHYTSLPRASTVEPGIFRLEPGGARAILAISGPTVSISSDSYLQWCENAMAWMLAVDCPVQLITAMSHLDSEKAQLAFDRRVEGWPRSPLAEFERDLAGEISDQSLALQHYVVFSPKIAGKDGIPSLSRLTKAGDAYEAKDEEARRALQSAVRLAASFGLSVEIPDHAEISHLVRQTMLGAGEAATGDHSLRINDQHHVVITVTKFPPTLEVGVVVDAMMRSNTRGIASLHLLPVDEGVARKALTRMSQAHRYARDQSDDNLDSEVAAADIQGVLAAIAQRQLKPMRVALTVSVSHPVRALALDAAERLESVLNGHGFITQRPSSPGFLPALALAPGCSPLGRSLQLTSDAAGLRLLPALGTPFSDQEQSLVGINCLTGSPAYLSVWAAPNHNMVVVGSSGAGKSVATKTLLVRHIMEGVSAVVIDPDSEYEPIMQAVGGTYYELGTEALNPLAVGQHTTPDVAAGLVLPVLSVMAGDEKGIRDGRPIRRLPDEDQGWLHAEIATFYRLWDERFPSQEPTMSNLIHFIDTEVKQRVLTPREADRCRIITARLRRYTQGKRALVFDRPSTFTVGQRPVAIGLKLFAMSYGADLTPALAVVLTSILAALDRREGRMVIVVDEAHRVTGDPDAGQVLGQLVRQARKYGAGVWMCSQKVEDFIHTDLGKTLAATASTKLILGAEEAAVDDVCQVFNLSAEERSAISPMSQGRGVLVSNNERTVVNVVPGWAIMSLANTSAMSASKRLPPREDEAVGVR